MSASFRLRVEPRGGQAPLPWLLVALVLGLLAPASEAIATDYTIAAGQDSSGSYWVFAEELARNLQEELGGQHSFRPMASQGSVQNIQALYADPGVAFALCQEDVARFFYSGDNNEFFFVGRERDYTVTSVARVFLENIYFATRPGLAASGEMARVHVGSPRSGSYATYTNLRRGLRPSWEELDDGDDVQRFIDREVDGVFFVATEGAGRLLRLQQSGVPFELVELKRTDLSYGLDVYRENAALAAGEGPGQAVRGVAVPCILLARRDLPPEVVSAAVASIVDRDAWGERWPLSASWLPGIQGEEERFGSLPIPPHPAVLRYTLGGFPYASYLSGFLLIAAALLAWLLAPRFSAGMRNSMIGHHSRRTMYRDARAILAVLLLTFVLAWGIKYFEIQVLQSGRSLTGSPFVSMDLLELLRWLLVFSVTGYEDAAFPISGAAKLSALFVVLAGLSIFALVGARFISTIVSRLMEQRTMREYQGLAGHVVIMHWNVRGQRLLKELRNPEAGKQASQRPVLVLVPSEEEAERLRRDRGPEDVLVLDGDPASPDVLRRASMERANSVIYLLPSAEDGRGADGAVLRAALAVRAYLGDRDPGVSRPHAVAELNDPPQRAVLDSLGIDEVVCAESLGLRLLAQAAHCPGVSHVYEEVLSSGSQSNEIYSRGLPAELVGHEADFRALLRFFLERRDQGNPALPIGVSLAGRGLPGGESKSLLNPSREELRGCGADAFQEGDRVLFLADSADAQPYLAAGGA